jgi:hypothetical protein
MTAKKTPNLERGLFRVYTIPTFLGILCLGTSLWYGYEYKKNTKSYYAFMPEYIAWLGDYTYSTNHPYAYACGWGDGDAYREYYLEKHKGIDQSGYRVTPRYDPTVNTSYIRETLKKIREYRFQTFTKPAIKCEQEKKFWRSLFYGLSLGPWGLHFFAKITVLPLFRWIIKGFNS